MRGRSSNKTEQLEKSDNLKIIEMVLQSRATPIVIPDMAFDSVEHYVDRDSVVGIVAGYSTVRLLDSNEFAYYFKPPCSESEAIRFIAGTFMNKLIISSIGVPKDTFCLIVSSDVLRFYSLVLG